MKIITAVKNCIFLCIFLLQLEALAQVKCEQALLTNDRPAPTKQDKSGAQILHEKDPTLHMSPLVQTAVINYQKTHRESLKAPVDKLNVWLNYLTRLLERADSSSELLERVKTILHDRYTIKFDDIPQSYYDLQARIARERGQGNATFSVEKKQQMAGTVIEDQTKSLDLWIEYLVSKDTSSYPMWLKYWMFAGMAKLSKYDSTTGTFGNRDKSTVTPFPELNREALALVADSVLKFLNKNSQEEIKDPELLKLLPGLNFGKLYGYMLRRFDLGKRGGFRTDQGVWVVYPQGLDYKPLVESLAGRNTGWCTAGEATAKAQLAMGDFHVYYSLDENGEPVIPRVAVRMQGTEVAEIRGVAEGQNLDSQISQSGIVSAKMKEFGAKAERFQRRDHDMRLLTAIEAKHKANIILSKDELVFLYEMNRQIEGFGYSKDPRIEEIKAQRDAKADVVVIFDNKYTRDEISTTTEEALSGKSKVHIGRLNLDKLKSADGLYLPEIIIGTLPLGGLKSVRGMKFPEAIYGNLYLNSLTSTEGLNLPDTIGGDLFLGNLKSSKGLKLPRVVKGDLVLRSLTSGYGLVLPETVHGYVDLYKLSSAEGVTFPTTIGRSLNLSSLKSAKGLTIPERIGGDLTLNSLKSATGLTLPKAIKGNLKLNGLTSAKKLIMPDGVRVYEGPTDISR